MMSLLDRSYITLHNIPGILISLDFKKAFDSLEWGFIINTLDVFNFGTSIFTQISKVQL